MEAHELLLRRLGRHLVVQRRRHSALQGTAARPNQKAGGGGGGGGSGGVGEAGELPDRLPAPWQVLLDKAQEEVAARLRGAEAAADAEDNDGAATRVRTCVLRGDRVWVLRVLEHHRQRVVFVSSARGAFVLTNTSPKRTSQLTCSHPCAIHGRKSHALASLLPLPRTPCPSLRSAAAALDAHARLPQVLRGALEGLALLLAAAGNASDEVLPRSIAATMGLNADDADANDDEEEGEEEEEGGRGGEWRRVRLPSAQHGEGDCWRGFVPPHPLLCAALRVLWGQRSSDAAAQNSAAWDSTCNLHRQFMEVRTHTHTHAHTFTSRSRL
mgnify:CR=1 FL=1